MSDKIKKALEAAYLAGFMESEQGYNGEVNGWPDNDVTKSDYWLDFRDIRVNTCLEELGVTKPDVFETIKDFNKFYGLPCPDVPTLSAVRDPDGRIRGFIKTVEDELKEGFDILEKYEAGGSGLEMLTDLADWYGDLVVYALSEAAKWGIPSEKVLQAIMESNFSKKQADGSTLKDTNGKVVKGPNFQPPEPAICRAIIDAGYRP